MTHKILAIDDHPQTLDIVVMTLRRYDYQVIGSLSPTEGLRLAEEEKPDLVLLDMNMPDMDGLEVCRRLRNNPQLASIPIIMFTATDEPAQKVAGFDAGADDYLTKPTDPDEMIARIEAILGRPEESLEQDESGIEAPPAEKTVVMPRSRDRGTTTMTAQGNLVAVLGARGGAGATLTAINLAASMARRSCKTTLIDLDMAQGHVALYLNRQGFGSLNALANLSGGAVAQQLPGQVVRLSKHLQLLLAHPNQDGRFPILSASQTETILDAFLQSGQYVVADIGRADSEAHLAVLNRADQVLVCLPPERVALSAAKLRLSHLQESLPPDTHLGTLIFDVGNRMNLPRRAIETYLDYPLQTVISISPDELAQSVNKGAILVGAYPQGDTAKRFFQLAGQYIQT